MKGYSIAKWGALGFLLNAAAYLLAEFLTAVGTGRSLDYVYRLQFISALGVYQGQAVEGVPHHFSPWAIVMNLGFILTAFGFIISYIFLFFPKFRKKSLVLAYVLLMVTVSFGFGSLLVGLYQGGVPGQDGLHGLGARLSFMMGNATLLLTGLFLPDKRPFYRTASILLAVIGFVAAYFLQEAIRENQVSVMAVYERLTVYPITIWQIMTGLTFLNLKNRHNQNKEFWRKSICP